MAVDETAVSSPLPELSDSVQEFLQQLENSGGVSQASLEDLFGLAEMAVEAGKTRPSQAGRIRYLSELGISVGKISKALDIRYQRVYQVVHNRDEIMRAVPEGAVPCQVCGRALTDPEHAKQRIGPICQRR